MSGPPGFIDAIQAVSTIRDELAVLLPGDSAELTLYSRALRPIWTRKLGFRFGLLSRTRGGVQVLDPADGMIWGVDSAGAISSAGKMRLPSDRNAKGTFRITSRLEGGALLATQVVTTELFDSTDSPQLRVMVFDSSGNPQRTLAVTTTENRIAHFAVNGERVMRSFFGRLFRYGTSTLIRTSPAGDRVILVARSVNSGERLARVTGLTRDGDTLFSRVLSARTPRVPKEFVDSVVHSHAKSVERYFPNQDRSVAAMRKMLHLGPFYPAVLDAVVAAENKLWLELPPRGGQLVWVVLDVAGRPGHEIRVPAEHVVIAASGNAFWTVYRSGGLIRFWRWAFPPA